MNELDFREFKQDLQVIRDLLSRGATAQHEEMTGLVMLMSSHLPIIEGLIDQLSDATTQ